MMSHELSPCGWGMTPPPNYFLNRYWFGTSYVSFIRTLLPYIRKVSVSSCSFSTSVHISKHITLRRSHKYINLLYLTSVPTSSFIRTSLPVPSLLPVYWSSSSLSIKSHPLPLDSYKKYFCHFNITVCT